MPKNSDSQALVAEIRSAEPRWEPGITSVSELPEEEKLLRLGYVPGPDEMSLAERESMASARYEAMGEMFEAIGAPAVYDLRNVGGKNFITPVKDQANCGSCVAFGSSATVEGTLRVQRNDPNIPGQRGFNFQSDEIGRVVDSPPPVRVGDRGPVRTDHG